MIRQPVRRQIGLLLAADEDREVGAVELAEELDAPPANVGYHLRVLTRCDVVELVPGRPQPAPVYRWSPRAQWARKLLDEGEE